MLLADPIRRSHFGRFFVNSPLGRATFGFIDLDSSNFNLKFCLFLTERTEFIAEIIKLDQLLIKTNTNKGKIKISMFCAKLSAEAFFFEPFKIENQRQKQLTATNLVLRPLQLNLNQKSKPSILITTDECN